MRLGVRVPVGFLNSDRGFIRMIRAFGRRQLILVAGYLAAMGAIASTIYYIPNYGWLEYATAFDTAWFMNIIGMPATVTVTSAGVLLNQFLIIKACTGIQVIATLTGIITPIPKLGWLKKAVGILLVVGLVYVANIARIAVQLWMYYTGIFNWTTIHDPGGFALGVVSVMLIVLLVDRFIPEFGNFVYSSINPHGR